MIPYRYIIALSLVFHFSLFTFHFAINSSYAQEKGQTLLEQGKGLLDSKDYNSALSILLEAVTQEPDNPEIYNSLGEAYYGLKRFEDAVESLKKSISLKPDFISPRLGLGIVYEAIKNSEGAMAEFREVLKIGEGTPDLPEVRIARERLKRLEVGEYIKNGRELFNNKKFEEALAEINTGISKDPENHVLYFMAGLTYKELGKPKDSLDAFKKVTDLNPQSPAGYFQIGDFHFRFGAYKEAIEAFREVLRLAPESKEGKEAASLIEKSEGRIKLRGYFEEASGAVKNEKYEAAEKVLQKILEIEPDNSFGLYNLGVVYFKTGRREEAIEILKKSLELSPADVKTRYQLAVVYHELEKFDEAIVEYGLAAASKADIEEVTMAREKAEMLKKYVTAKEGAERIDVLMESGDMESALKEAEAILSKEERNHEAHFMLGRIYMRKGDMEKAVASLKKAVGIKSDYWDAYVLLGQVYELWKRYNDAADVYRAVISGAPKTKQGTLSAELLKVIDIPIHFERAKKYMAGGDLDGALKEISALLEKAPENPVALYNAGILYDRLDRPGDAETYLRKAIAKKPDYVQAHLQLALVYQSAQKFAEAEQEFKAVLSITLTGKEASIAKVRLGMIQEEEALSEHMRDAFRLMKLEDYVGAKEELETLIAISPKNYIAYFQLGVLFDKMDRVEDAIDALVKAVEIKPDYAMAYLYLAKLYEQEDMIKDAREAYRKAGTFGAGTREGEIADIALRRLRNWRISGSIGNTLDSNIALGAGARRQTGISTSHNLNLSYSVYTTKEKGFIVGASLNNSLTYETQLMGLSYRGNMRWYHHISEEHSYEISGSYTYSTFEGEPSYKSYNYSLNTSINPRAIPALLSLGYSFSDTSSFVNKTSDAVQHTVSLSMRQDISLRDRVNGSYTFSSYLNKDPIGSNYARRSNTLSLRFSRSIRPGFSVSSGYYIGLTNYSNADSTTFFTRFRRNISQDIDVNISYNLSENVSLSFSVSHTRVTSNLGIPTAEDRQKLADILAAPIPTVGGGYTKETVGMSINVGF